MKTHIALLILFLVSTIFAQQITPDKTQSEISITRGMFDLEEATAHSRDWDPASGIPYPLSITEAVRLTSDWMRLRCPSTQKFEPVSIALRSYATKTAGKRIWLYCVDYREVQGNQLIDSPIYLAYVAADGFILECK